MEGVSQITSGRKLILCQQKVNFLKTEDKSLIKFWKKDAGRILKEEEEEVQIDNRKQTTSIEDN